MRTSALAVMSSVALAIGGCSPSLSQPKAPLEPDAETSTTSITSGEAMPSVAAEPLPANHAPLESWFRGTPTGAAAAPAQPAVQPLDPWSYP